jgi:hypothetical protein
MDVFVIKGKQCVGGGGTIHHRTGIVDDTVQIENPVKTIKGNTSPMSPGEIVDGPSTWTFQ